MVLFTESVSRRNTFVGGKCAPPSALLVYLYMYSFINCRHEIIHMVHVNGQAMLNSLQYSLFHF